MIWGIVALLALLLVVTWAWFLSRRANPVLPLLQQQVTHLSEQVSRALGEISAATSSDISKLQQKMDDRLGETVRLIESTHQTVGQRLEKNTEIFGQVQERLGRLDEANKQILTIGEEITRLQEILRVPKLRGNLGELFLEELLSQILPTDYYQMQHMFKSGDKVDAIVRLPQGNLVSIDAKFPLENFRRMITCENEAERKAMRKTFVSDVRKHVDQIAAKYILPDEGTLDFALLYIPAENVYYEVILAVDRGEESHDIFRYALNKRVIPVSPGSLYAYLQLILLGLRGLRIEKRAREIFDYLSRLGADLEKLREDLELVGRHLGNTASAFDRSEKRLGMVQDRLQKVEQPLAQEATEAPRASKLVDRVS